MIASEEKGLLEFPSAIFAREEVFQHPTTDPSFGYANNDTTCAQQACLPRHDREKL